MPVRATTLDDLGDGVFRKVRRALGVTAFGVNGIVLPPGVIEEGGLEAPGLAREYRPDDDVLTEGTGPAISWTP